MIPQWSAPYTNVGLPTDGLSALLVLYSEQVSHQVRQRVHGECRLNQLATTATALKIRQRINSAFLRRLISQLLVASRTTQPGFDGLSGPFTERRGRCLTTFDAGEVRLVATGG